jgi:3-hydroxyacyl-CoA dehydrogenase
VLVLGAGRMGSQIACEYALGDHRVMLLGGDPRRSEQAARAAFALAAQARLGSAQTRAQAQARLTVLGDAGELRHAPEIVVESIPEELERKAAILGALAARWPEAILATNTSSLSITELGRAVGAPSRVVGTHYWNPPLLMPLVEVIGGAETSSEVSERMVAGRAGRRRPRRGRRGRPRRAGAPLAPDGVVRNR